MARMISLRRLLLPGLFGLLFLAACAPQVNSTDSPQPSASPSPAGQLTPYVVMAPTGTPSPGVAVTPTALPSPTPTPRKYTIARGDDLFGIALRNNVSLDDLMKLNPNVDAQFLKVGDVLLIPSSTLAAPNVTPQPTAVTLPIAQPNCLPAADGGAWCFVLVSNDQDFAIESLAGTIRLADQQASQVLSQTAFAALNQVLPGGTLPLMAYFPPPLPEPPFQASAELNAALPVAGDILRYLPVTVSGSLDSLSASGQAAQVSGTVELGAVEQSASQVWVAAAGFDAVGRVIGVRRWEQSGLSLSAGESLPFSFQVYSAGPPIERVEFWAEAQP